MTAICTAGMHNTLKRAFTQRGAESCCIAAGLRQYSSHDILGKM
jgi:hypothetical protein